MKVRDQIQSTFRRHCPSKSPHICALQTVRPGLGGPEHSTFREAQASRVRALGVTRRPQGFMAGGRPSRCLAPEKPPAFTLAASMLSKDDGDGFDDSAWALIMSGHLPVHPFAASLVETAVQVGPELTLGADDGGRKLGQHDLNWEEACFNIAAGGEQTSHGGRGEGSDAPHLHPAAAQTTQHIIDGLFGQQSPSLSSSSDPQLPAHEAVALTKEERARRRRAFHKVHTRRSRAKLNDKLEHLRRALPTPPAGTCVKSKAQILDWAIACADGQRFASPAREDDGAQF
jgi:hypothetical protein